MANLNQDLKQCLVSMLRHSKRRIREKPLDARVVRRLITVGGGKLRVERTTVSVKEKDSHSRRLVLRIVLIVTLVISAVIWHKCGLPLSQLLEIVRSVMVRESLVEQHSMDDGGLTVGKAAVSNHMKWPIENAFDASLRACDRFYFGRVAICVLENHCSSSRLMRLTLSRNSI